MRFHFAGIDETGEEETGSVEAESETLAYQMLRAKGITPFELSTQPVADALPWYRRDITLSATRVDLGEQASLARLFGLLLGQSLPLPTVLNLLSHHTKNRRAKRQFSRMEQALRAGSSLKDAFDDGPDRAAFSDAFRDVISLSEHITAPEQAFERLAETLQRQQKTRADLNSALLYPGILVFVAIVVMSIMVGYLAPTLVPMFSGMGQTLPSGLATLMTLNQFFTFIGPLIWILPVVVVCILFITLTTDTGRKVAVQMTNRLPLIGPLRGQANLLNEVETLSLLLAAKLPLAEALDRCSDRAGATFFPFSEAADALRKGAQSHTVVAAASLPDSLKKLYALGEENNQLAQCLDGARQIMAEEHKRRITRSMALLTPALTLVLGVGIGGLIYSVMSAILEVNQLAF